MFWLRLLTGVVFAVSGFEKAVGPSGNFLYVIQQYQVLPLNLAKIVSVTFPWIEMVVGVFLVLGLWLPEILLVSGLMSIGLMSLVGQAIIRKLPINDCGCFGDLVHLPLTSVIFIDMAMVTAVLVCGRYMEAASRFSLDNLFAEKE